LPRRTPSESRFLTSLSTMPLCWQLSGAHRSHSHARAGSSQMVPVARPIWHARSVLLAGLKCFDVVSRSVVNDLHGGNTVTPAIFDGFLTSSSPLHGQPFLASPEWLSCSELGQLLCGFLGAFLRDSLDDFLHALGYDVSLEWCSKDSKDDGDNKYRASLMAPSLQGWHGGPIPRPSVGLRWCQRMPA